MTTVFKKTLALSVAVVLCVTAFIGCLTVSAETTVPTISVESVETVPGGLANVRINLENLSAICAMQLDVIFANGIRINSVDGVEAKTIVEQYEEEGGNVNIITTSEGKPAIRFVDIINFAYGEYNISNSTLSLNVNITAPTATGTYDVTLDVDAADQDENLLKNITLNNGTVTVKEQTLSEYTLTNTVSRISGATNPQKLLVKFNWEFNGGTPDSYGVKVYKDNAKKLSGDCWFNSALSESTTYVEIKGISCSSFDNKFIFVPYVVKDGQTITGSTLSVSYADYLNDRIASTSSTVTEEIKTRAEALVNFAKIASNSSEATLTTYDAAVTYTAATTPTVSDTDTGEFTANPIVTGNISNGNTSFNLYVKFNFEAYTGEVKEQGVLIYRNAGFITFPTSLESSGVNHKVVYTGKNAVVVNGFNFSTLAEKLVFVPYVIDDSDIVHFAHAANISYADYLGSKLVNSATDTAKVNTAKKALTVMDLYNTLNGTSLYSKN